MAKLTRRKYVRNSRRPTKTIKKIVKQTLGRQIERKTLQIGRDDTNMKYITQYFWDPMQSIVAGSGQGQRIGNKITDVYLNLSLTYTHTDNALYQGSGVRVLLLKTDQKYANFPTGWAANNTLTAFEWLFSSQYDMTGAVTNKYDYTILKDMVIRSHRNIAGASGVPTTRHLRYKIGTAIYEADLISGVAYQKFRNIYVFCGISNAATANTDPAGNLVCNGFISFKDA